MNPFYSIRIFIRWSDINDPKDTSSSEQDVTRKFLHSIVSVNFPAGASSIVQATLFLVSQMLHEQAFVL